MSSSFIIPFNHAPINTVTQNTTLTVSAGKYVRVNIGSAKLPILNGTDLYLSYSLPSTSIPTTTTARKIAIPCNCSRFNITWNANIGNGQFHFGDVVSLSSDYQDNIGNVSSYQSPIGEYQAGQIIQIRTANSVAISAMSFFIEPSNKEIWLNEGDVLSFSAGSITYEEYNVIS